MNKNIKILGCYTVFFFLVASTSITADEVYKTVNPDGTATFSDSGNSSQIITVNPPNTITLPGLPASEDSAVVPVEAYTSLQITAPENDSWIRGVELPTSLQAKVAAEPALQAGHKFQFFLNNQAVGDAGQKPSIAFTGLSRGSYKVKAVILDDKDTILITSDAVEFNVFQATAPKKQPRTGS